MKVQLAQPADFAAILQLQARFQLDALPESELEQGFVTTKLDLETLAKMHEYRAIWVVLTDDKAAVAAYACAVEWDFYADSNFVAAVFTQFPLPMGEQTVTAENSFIYGPACIDEKFRGRNLLNQITDSVKARYAENRAFGICFIDVRNARSLAAHERKLGFTRLTELPFGDVIYHMLAFPMR